LIALGCALACPSAAAADSIDPLPMPPGDERVLVAPIRDRVLDGPAATKAAAPAGLQAGSARTRFLRTPAGEEVEVTVSGSYADTEANRQGAQRYVDFLGRLAHGPELRRFSLVIAPQREIAVVCGNDPGVVACYSKRNQRAFLPGSDNGGRFTVAYALAHEYGHHIAVNRRNDPFPAGDWGPKHWASHEYVCTRTARRLFFPGGQGRRYRDNPGRGSPTPTRTCPSTSRASASSSTGCSTRSGTARRWPPSGATSPSRGTGRRCASFAGGCRRRRGPRRSSCRSRSTARSR
jgi:hypothetical protein